MMFQMMILWNQWKIFKNGDTELQKSPDSITTMNIF